MLGFFSARNITKISLPKLNFVLLILFFGYGFFALIAHNNSKQNNIFFEEFVFYLLAVLTIYGLHHIRILTKKDTLKANCIHVAKEIEDKFIVIKNGKFSFLEFIVGINLLIYFITINKSAEYTKLSVKAIYILFLYCTALASNLALKNHTQDESNPIKIIEKVKIFLTSAVTFHAAIMLLKIQIPHISIQNERSFEGFWISCCLCFLAKWIHSRHRDLNSFMFIVFLWSVITINITHNYSAIYVNLFWMFFVFTATHFLVPSIVVVGFVAGLLHYLLMFFVTIAAILGCYNFNPQINLFSAYELFCLYICSIMLGSLYRESYKIRWQQRPTLNFLMDLEKFLWRKFITIMSCSGLLFFTGQNSFGLWILCLTFWAFLQDRNQQKLTLNYIKHEHQSSNIYRRF